MTRTSAAFRRANPKEAGSNRAQWAIAADTVIFVKNIVNCAIFYPSLSL
jgi:hypothetical protein